MTTSGCIALAPLVWFVESYCDIAYISNWP